MQKSQMKILVSATILIVGLVLTIVALPDASGDTDNSGILVDFGDFDVTFTEVNADNYGDPVSALRFACEVNGFTLEMSEHAVTSIGGLKADGASSWALYVVNIGENQWVRVTSNPSSISIVDYSAVCWGYCTPDSLPSPAVDSTGVNFYNYHEPKRVVTLAPALTEYVCAVGAIDLIVATDFYSNYPQEIVDRQNNGTVEFTGGFTNPSYEAIIKQTPDLVICQDSVSAHISMADKLRNSGINVFVASGGESIDAVRNNTFMMGFLLGGEDVAREQIRTLNENIEEIGSILEASPSIWNKKVMVALSALKSPYVAGSETYVSDIFSVIHADNVYSEEYGWPQVNVESIVISNPEVIIVVTSGYSPNEHDYNAMLNSLSNEWKSTDAYKNGNVYMFVQEAHDLLSRPGPRVAQLAELLARVLHPYDFKDDIKIPKYIGNDYMDYLTITVDDDSKSIIQSDGEKSVSTQADYMRKAKMPSSTNASLSSTMEQPSGKTSSVDFGIVTWIPETLTTKSSVISLQ